MSLPPELAVPAALAVLAIIRRAVRRDAPSHDRALRLFAGIAAIMARDKRPRADRALDVLWGRRDDQLPPGAGPPS